MTLNHLEKAEEAMGVYLVQKGSKGLEAWVKLQSTCRASMRP
jgi:hypothetical protein